MKKTLILLNLAFLVAIIFNSCKKEDTDPRDNYVGSFLISQDWENVFGQSGSKTYSLTIIKSSTNSSEIILNNLDGGIDGVRATVSGTTFQIPSQSVAYVDYSWTVHGNGSLVGNNIVFNYSCDLDESGMTGGFDGDCSGTRQ
jgi:hypothetical protein